METARIHFDNSYLIREKQIILDSNLAELYGVETKQIDRAIKRNTYHLHSLHRELMSFGSVI